MSGNSQPLSLTTKIFLALFLGAFTGILIQNFMQDPSMAYLRNNILVDGIFYVVGNGFIRLMQMLVVPLVFCSIVCGTMSIGDSKTLGTVGIKTICFYLFTTAMAIIIALCIANLINPGIGLDQSLISTTSGPTTAKDVKLADTILNMIPKNPIGSMASGDMLPIILFALIVGILMAQMRNSYDTLGSLFSQGNGLMMDMTMMVMKLAPIGVFCLVAKTFANLGISAFIPLLKYVFSVSGALFIQCFLGYMLLLIIFTRLNPLLFLKKFWPVMAFAFSTATSNATIPMSIDTLGRKLGVSKKISAFTIPLGETINMDGTSIMQGVAVVFIAQAFNIDLSIADYGTVIVTATIASIGTAGVPSVGLVTLTMILASVNLPIEGIAIIMGIDRILDMMRTAVNITGDAVCTTIVAHREKAIDYNLYNNKDL